MSVIGYFTTSPVVLMRRWEPSGGTTTTTTTIDCNQFYTIDLYVASGSHCPLCTGCDAGDCGECYAIQLEYSTDGGSEWNGIADTDSVNTCTYLGTMAIGICETSLIFRMTIKTFCSGGPIYFKYAANSSTCPNTSTAACGDCTDSETINVMPTGNTSIAFTICTDCSDGCCRPCCVIPESCECFEIEGAGLLINADWTDCCGNVNSGLIMNGAKLCLQLDGSGNPNIQFNSGGAYYTALGTTCVCGQSCGR